MTFHKNWEKAGGAARTEFYRTWRTKQGLCCVGDTDQIEYRYKGGELTIVAVLEMGVADWGPEDGMLVSFLARVSPERPQGALLRLVAEKLGVPLYGVLLLKDQVEAFHCWNLNTMAYRFMGQKAYVEWLGSL